MSFLHELKLRKDRLKPTITTITNADGSKVTRNSSDQTETIELNATPGYIVDLKPDPIAACILDRFLYLGSQDSVSWENINQLGLTHILSVGIEIPLTDLTITNLFVNCLDLPETNLSEIIDKCNEFIESARLSNGTVLVHCNAGISRSTSIVLGYLIKIRRFSLDEAYQLVLSKRPAIKPNEGFWKQLKLL